MKQIERYTHEFHKIHYNTCLGNFPTFMGVTVEKSPLDLWVYQEIIKDTEPEVVIETGTQHGGSALYFACMCDLIGVGEVITIDTEEKSKVKHPRITKLIGNSVSDEIISNVRDIVGDKTAMVSLDSSHVKTHVLEEMELYNQFVSVGNYMVVEDTNINGHPVLPAWGEGPMEAVTEFLHDRNDFVIDYNREKFLLSFYPKGYLKRVKEK